MLGRFIWWRHDIWTSEELKFDYLKNEKSFRSEIKNIFFVSQVLSFKYTQTLNRDQISYRMLSVYSVKIELWLYTKISSRKPSWNFTTVLRNQAEIFIPCKQVKTNHVINN